MSPVHPIFFEIRDYYEVLGVGRDAPKEDIMVAAHSRIAGLRSEPSNDPEVAQHIRETSDAARVLTNPLKRAAYDARLAANEKQFAWWDANDQVWRLWLADDALAESVRLTAFGGSKSPVPEDQTSEPPNPLWEKLKTALWIFLVGWFVFTLLMVLGQYLPPQSEEPVSDDSTGWSRLTSDVTWADVSVVDADSAGQIGISNSGQIFALTCSENLAGRNIGSTVDLGQTEADSGQS